MLRSCPYPHCPGVLRENVTFDAKVTSCDRCGYMVVEPHCVQPVELTNDYIRDVTMIVKIKRTGRDILRRLFGIKEI